MPAGPGRFAERVANARRGGELIARLIAAKDLSHLEQSGVGEAAVGISLRGGDQARNKTRPHVGKVGGDGIGECQLRLAAAEQFGLLLGDEGPGQRLNQIAGSKGAPGFARAKLDRREHRLARRGAAIERRRRHAVDAENAGDLLDDIGLALHVAAP